MVVGSFLARERARPAVRTFAGRSRPLPAAVAGTSAGDAPTTGVSSQPVPSATSTRAPSSHAAVTRPGVPVAIDIAVRARTTRTASKLRSNRICSAPPARWGCLPIRQSSARPSRTRLRAVLGHGHHHRPHQLRDQRPLGARCVVRPCRLREIVRRCTCDPPIGGRVAVSSTASWRAASTTRISSPATRSYVGALQRDGCLRACGLAVGPAAAWSPAAGPFDPDTGEYQTRFPLRASGQLNRPIRRLNFGWTDS